MMDWTYLKKILRIFLGVLLLAAGIWMIVLNFSMGFEISFAFFAFLILLGGFTTVFYGIHALSKPD